MATTTLRCAVSTHRDGDPHRAVSAQPTDPDGDGREQCRRESQYGEPEHHRVLRGAELTQDHLHWF
jgi:hypothetical protein